MRAVRASPNYVMESQQISDHLAIDQRLRIKYANGEWYPYEGGRYLK